MQEMFEINEAIEKFDYLDIESYDEELLESLISLWVCLRFREILNELNSDYYDDYEKQQKRKKALKIGHGVGIGALEPPLVLER